jgi:AcrR family transcriptional regulator
LQEFSDGYETPEITDRKPRADATHNRERILEVAKGEFTRVGANASLEDIAKKAGVGPRTLYRRFPTREDLLVAVYRSEMEKLAAAAQTLADSKSPVEALRSRLLLFVYAVETKHIIAPVLNTVVGDPKKVIEGSYAQIHEALRAPLKRAVKSGDIRKDLDPIDLLRAIVGVANVSASPDWQLSAPAIEMTSTAGRGWQRPADAAESLVSANPSDGP